MTRDRKLVELFSRYGRRMDYSGESDAYTCTIGQWQGPACRDLRELEVSLESARLGGNACIVEQNERNWVAEVDRLREIAALNAAEAHEAHTELGTVLRELALARAQVMHLEQELRLIQAKAVL